MKNPCQKNCPMRQVGCAITCKSYKLYKSYKNNELKIKAKNQDKIDFIFEEYKKVKKHMKNY